MRLKGVLSLILLLIISVHIGSELIEAKYHHRKPFSRQQGLRDEHDNSTNSSLHEEHWENTSSIDWILDHFDINQDGSLDSEEFESYFSSIFPHAHEGEFHHDEESRDEHEHDEHPECPTDEDLS